MTADELARVMPRLRYVGSCWEWPGAKSHGYGQVQRTGTRRLGRVHRMVYEHFVGAIPEGLTLDHLCRNRACANPAHLEPVTVRENILRSMAPAAINARKTHCNAGHPLVEGNLVRQHTGKRLCRICARASLRAHRARVRARKVSE